MDKTQVKQAVDRAIKTLLQQDAYLLKHDVNERSISHRLAMYLQQEFPDHNIDCEYHRNKDESKRLDLLLQRAGPQEVPIQDTEARTAYPDIIVHQRGSNSENILVIEIKKTTSTRGDQADQLDKAKLRAFRNAPYRYHFTVFLRLETRRGTEPGVDECDWGDI